jgi:hypothetical protein
MQSAETSRSVCATVARPKPSARPQYRAQASEAWPINSCKPAVASEIANSRAAVASTVSIFVAGGVVTVIMALPALE